jgi:hypothetical protein
MATRSIRPRSRPSSWPSRTSKEQIETEDAGKIKGGIQNVTEAAMKLGEAIYKAEQEKPAGESEDEDEPRECR